MKGEVKNLESLSWCFTTKSQRTRSHESDREKLWPSLVEEVYLRVSVPLW